MLRVVASPAALRAVYRAPGVLRSSPSREVRLAVAGISIDERTTWQNAAKRYQLDCGCSTGAAFALGAAFLALAVQILGGLPASPVAVVRAAVEVIGAMFITGLLGKGVGLMMSRRRFRDVTLRLLEDLDRDERSAT
jgi:hypothetical protein